MKINNFAANYNNLFIYDGERIVFETCRLNDLELDLFGIEIRNARKANFSKNDCFEMKSTKNNEYRCFTNGKDLYIPVSVFELISIEEKEASKHDGEINYKKTYSFKLHCEAYKYNKHWEKITDLPSDMPLSEYDPDGKFGSGFSKKHNMYDHCQNYKTKEEYICKRWLTYDPITELVIDSDYYTRTVKDADRIEREKIAEVLSSCLYSGKSVSHYEVARILEKLNVTIK